jgi:hypothetical protein
MVRNIGGKIRPIRKRPFKEEEKSQVKGRREKEREKEGDWRGEQKRAGLEFFNDLWGLGID